MLLALGACGGGGGSGQTAPPPTSGVVQPPASVERQVNATTTDSTITTAPLGNEAPHITINPSPSVTARGRLFVFLPGTQGRPAQYTYILRAGAVRGFHAVGINYPNQTAMGAYCQTSNDPDCYWKARSAVIFGPAMRPATCSPGIVSNTRSAADATPNQLKIIRKIGTQKSRTIFSTQQL